MAASSRDLALFNLAIDNKLPASDLVRLKVEDICFGDVVRDRGRSRSESPVALCNSRSRK